MTIQKCTITAAFLVVYLLISLMVVSSVRASVTPTPFSIAEKDLFHYYAVSPNPATPCATFTSAPSWVYNKNVDLAAAQKYLKVALGLSKRQGGQTYKSKGDPSLQ